MTEPARSMLSEFLHSTDDRWKAWRAVAVFAMVLVIASTFVVRSVRAQRAAERAARVEAAKDLPAAVPNGGLVIDALDLDWGETWESHVMRVIAIHNPTANVLHVEFRDGCAPGYDPNLLTLQPGESRNIEVTFSSSMPADNGLATSIAKSFAMIPIIAEHPGRHPGWQIQLRINRAMSITTLEDGSYRVTPLRPLDRITATVDGSTEGIVVEGPLDGGDYLIRCSRDLDWHERLWVHAHMPEAVSTAYVP